MTICGQNGYFKRILWKFRFFKTEFRLVMHVSLFYIIQVVPLGVRKQIRKEKSCLARFLWNLRAKTGKKYDFWHLQVSECRRIKNRHFVIKNFFWGVLHILRTPEIILSMYIIGWKPIEKKLFKSKKKVLKFGRFWPKTVQ